MLHEPQRCRMHGLSCGNYWNSMVPKFQNSTRKPDYSHHTFFPPFNVWPARLLIVHSPLLSPLIHRGDSTHTQPWNQQSTQTPHAAWLTLVLTLTLAPASNNIWTTPQWPFWAATYNAVAPSCTESRKCEQVNHHSSQTHSLYNITWLSTIDIVEERDRQRKYLVLRSVFHCSFNRGLCLTWK